MSKHKNLLFLAAGIIAGIFLYNYHPFHEFLKNLGAYGYAGAFIAGILYDSTVTVTTSIVILLILAESFSKLEIGIIAGIGAVLGDLIIFKLVKDNLFKEFQFIYDSVEVGIGKKRTRVLKHIVHTKYFHWMLPIFAAILIGSPFPDEIAWGLMGATKIKPYQVILVSFTFNFTGIVLILAASNFVKR